MSDSPETISIDDFAKIKLRVGKVVEAHEHPDADKLLVITVDMGDERRQVCAGIRGHYQPDELVGKNLIIVANLAPRKMRGIESQGMLLAASDLAAGSVVCLTTMSDVTTGSEVR